MYIVRLIVVSFWILKTTLFNTALDQVDEKRGKLRRDAVSFNNPLKMRTCHLHDISRSSINAGTRSDTDRARAGVICECRGQKWAQTGCLNTCLYRRAAAAILTPTAHETP